MDDWRPVTSKSTGKVYWYNKKTKKTSWTKPVSGVESRDFSKSWNAVYNSVKTRLFQQAMCDRTTGHRILDLGCGAGDVDKVLYDELEYYVGVDASQSNADKWVDRVKNWEKKGLKIGDKTYKAAPYFDPGNPTGHSYYCIREDTSKLTCNASLVVENMLSVSFPKSTTFNLVSAHFSLDFVWKNMGAAQSLVFKISESLERGGAFVGIVLDDKAVQSVLENHYWLPPGYSFEKKSNGELLFNKMTIYPIKEEVFRYVLRKYGFRVVDSVNMNTYADTWHISSVFNVSESKETTAIKGLFRIFYAVKNLWRSNN